MSKSATMGKFQLTSCTVTTALLDTGNQIHSNDLVYLSCVTVTLYNYVLP